MTPLQFEKLLLRHGNSICGFCCHLTCNRDMGEELYQDTMLKALELRGRISCKNDSEEEILKLRNYCMGIAVRLYKNRCRKEWKNEINFSMDDYKNYLQFEAKSNPEQENIEREICECLKKCVEKLSLKKRSVVYMFYYSDMSIEEISNALNLPTGTVKSRLNAARKEIRTEMEAKGYDGLR